MLLEEGICYDQCVLLEKLCYPLFCFIMYSKAKLACYSRYLLTSYFYIPLSCDEKYIFFFGVSSRKSLHLHQFSSVQSLSYVRLCDPMTHSTPGLPIHHQLLKFTQTHAHQLGDVIQLSHPLLSPSPPALNPSQHQGLFQ